MAFPYEDLVVDIPDYPVEGVVFKDITPVWNNPEAFRAMVDGMAAPFAESRVTKVVGAEARGFIVGAPVALALNAGFVPARKPGKLPREVKSATYELEYGSDALEIHVDAITPDDTVLIVDDLIATGGTVAALVKLVEEAGAKLAGLSFFMELASLEPRKRVAAVTDAPIHSEMVVY